MMAERVKELSIDTSSSVGGIKEGETTSTSESASPNVTPKLPLPRGIFSRTRSSSQQSATKDDSDDQEPTKLESLSESDKEKKKGSWQFFLPQKPSKPTGTSWIPLPFSITMKHYEKNAEIHKIFSQLPKSEKLIDDYSCALQRDILIHGRLYVTQNWICFYANIFSWETLLTIPLRTVVSVTKERTAILIPNAILLTTTVEKYGFSSFMSRDISYNIIFKVWQNSLLDDSLSPLELVKAARKAWGDNAEVGTAEQLWGEDNKDSGSSPKLSRHSSLPTHVEIGQVPATSGWEMGRSAPTTYVSNSYSSSQKKSNTTTSSSRKSSYPITRTKPDDSGTSQDSKQDSTSSSLTKNSPNIIDGNSTDTPTDSATMPNITSEDITASIVTTPTSVPDLIERVSNANGDSGSKHDGGSSDEFEAFSFPDDMAEVSCGCAEHVGRTIINEIYNAEVEIIFQLLFTDSDFFKSFLKLRNTTNIEIGDWITQADGTRLRDVTYTLALNYSFGPKFTPCTEHQIYQKNGQPGVKHIVQTDVVNGNVPYGDAFYVSILFCMTRVAHDKTRLRVTGNICFKKNCWGVVKNLIERNAGDGMRSYYNHLDTALKEYLATLPTKRLHKTRNRLSRRRHKRQLSGSKISVSNSSRGNQEENVGEESTSLRNRRGSISSKRSKSSDQKIGSDTAESATSVPDITEYPQYSWSLPKVNVILTVILGILILSNVILYNQLKGYDGIIPHDTKHRVPQAGLEIKSLPESNEEWIALFKLYTEQQNSDRQKLLDTLKVVVTAMQQMENTISSTRQLMETYIDSVTVDNKA